MEFAPNNVIFLLPHVFQERSCKREVLLSLKPGQSPLCDDRQSLQLLHGSLVLDPFSLKMIGRTWKNNDYRHIPKKPPLQWLLKPTDAVLFLYILT